MGDIVAGIISLSLGVGIYLTARKFPTLGGGYPGPGFFPQILGVMLACAGLILAVQGVRKRPVRPTVRKFFWRREWLNALVVVAAVVGYLFAAPRIGFSLTMAALLTATMVVFGVPVRKALPIAILTVASMFMLFGRILRVPLPAGPWGW
ncbi:MAG: tripartite tricarboxylate transporter TctB family protein [Armatimonadota bacterium]|nr:tripartite tricarboxylate transporter TctB family protein [Armatimonadota bacterium]